MSDLLNQASLVMVPSGYKEDTVYSVVPTDGSGDLSFTRASNGTRINSAGLVEVCPWNLLQYSEDFSNGVWANYGTGTVTTNTTTAPNGTTTADKFIPNTTNTSHACEQNMGTTSGAIVMSLYAKADGYNWVCFNSYVGGFKFTWFNISTGTIGTVASGVSASIESVGNGWYRCIVSLTGGASTYFSIIPANANNVTSFAGDGTSGILIWGAQLNIGSTAKPYFPTTDRLNVPRLTYQNGGGGCPSLLLEKQSTNFARNWNFTVALWDKNVVTVVANSATSPDGTNNAYLIYPTSSGTDRFLYDDQGSTSYTANANYTTTVYAKASGLNFAYIRFEDKTDTHAYVYFNLATGVVGSTTGSVTIVSKTIEAMGNGWYRLRVTANMGTGTGGKNNVLFGVADGDGSTYATASGTNGVLFYGPQSEQSDYPTSPIPTSGSSATRVADACYKTGISSLIGQTEGTMFVDVSGPSKTGDARYMTLSNGATSNRIVIYSTSLTSIGVYLQNPSGGGALGFNTVNGRMKIAFTYKNNDLRLYLNGVLKDAITSFTSSFTLNSVTVGAYEDYQVYNSLDQSINQAIIFPTALTNAEAIALTTL